MFSLRRAVTLLATSSALAACATVPPPAPVVQADSAPVAAPAVDPNAPVQPTALVSEVAIPHQEFKLDNGLTVLVHEDRKAPVVAVSTWYNVGSKDEPAGKTGFAHLFEHIMFNGSENLPGDFFTYLQQVGATDYNGTTNFDRTNYFQTVPKGALERALFLESDRMGYLLGAVTQEKLDNQIGVVQNEKRQGDNRPGGLVFYEVLETLFPEGHPYRHSVIGSMADLDSASLADIKQWFIDKYGPNNAVLVLAGDIDAAEARPLVEKYFGAIKRGPQNVPAAAPVPMLTQPVNKVMKDRVAATQISRYWPAPGITDEQMVALEVGGSVLGGLASSRLDNALVRDEKIAVSVSAGMSPFQRVGMFVVNATAKPGVDPALVERRVDEIVRQFIAEGPTEDEVQRAVMSEVSGRIRGLEQVGGFGGKAVALANGEVLAGDSDHYRRTLQQYASITPASVRTAMQQWVAKPALNLRLEPGDRPPYVEAKGPKKASRADIPSTKTPRPIPPVAQTPPLDFPDVQHVRLSNGMEVHYAQRNAVPVTQLALAFDAGYSADAPAQRGVQNLTLALLDEGAAGKSSQQLAEEQERLGAQIYTSGGADQSVVGMGALSANLGPSLDLLADIVKRPDFASAEVERVRAQTLTAISQAQKDPNAMATRALPPLLYGASHPYATTSLGDVAAVQAVQRDQLVGFQQSWLRPDNAEIFVVSSLPLAELMPQLESRFGNWTAPAAPKGVKTFAAAPARPVKPRIVLIDRPGSPQSIIMAGQVTPVDPMADIVPISGASEVFGGNFLSRINMDLRETKGWSYGVRGGLTLQTRVVPYTITAPVQSNRTGDSIAALNRQLQDILGNKGVTDEELTRLVSNNVDALPGRFETSSAVLNAMMTNDLYGRPDDYYEQLAGKYRGLSRPMLNAALRDAVDPKGFVWVVVGDAKTVRPQLAKLKMPIEVIEPQ